MSVFCPKCGKRTYNEFKCDYCQYQIQKSYIDEDLNRTVFKFSNNIILIIATIFIAISVSYIAFSKYRERTEMEQAFKYITGSDDISSYKNMTIEDQMKLIEKSKMNKDINNILKKQNEMIKKQMSF